MDKFAAVLWLSYQNNREKKRIQTRSWKCQVHNSVLSRLASWIFAEQRHFHAAAQSLGRTGHPRYCLSSRIKEGRVLQRYLSTKKPYTFSHKRTQYAQYWPAFCWTLLRWYSVNWSLKNTFNASEFARAGKKNDLIHSQICGLKWRFMKRFVLM